ncbi:Tll0287-like domain-containing protein [Amaricoccus macauensis]|uniref:Tll0287-like domain-containing protein n=1 Tax=Amaricoccus macauensis TaxID=57001 RepID=UPI003C7BE4C3
MYLKSLIALAVIWWGGSLGPATAQATQDELLETGHHLAEVLRAARDVVSENQDLINDPDIAEKGLTPDVFMGRVRDRFAERNGAPPISPGMTDMQIALVTAQLDSIQEVISEAQDLFNAPGIGFKGFIPAYFARLINDRFGERVAETADIKVTAPLHLVRNRKSLPDPWELAVIEERFLADDWERGGVFHDIADGPNGPEFRMLFPDYYGASCLSCHGQPKGEVDVTGFPKEGASEGDLGGVISIRLKP